jgi:hypothetical protein
VDGQLEPIGQQRLQHKDQLFSWRIALGFRFNVVTL